jgi:hypothetical protein
MPFEHALGVGGGGVEHAEPQGGCPPKPQNVGVPPPHPHLSNPVAGSVHKTVAAPEVPQHSL